MPIFLSPGSWVLQRGNNEWAQHVFFNVFGKLSWGLAGKWLELMPHCLNTLKLTLGFIVKQKRGIISSESSTQSILG